MLVKLPVIATDPNSGLTVGVLPVWVIRDPSTGRIVELHAPSLTYNPNFGVTPTYRFYYYPAPSSQIQALASYSTTANRQAQLQWINPNAFGGSDYVDALVEWDRDGSQRFYGFGPDSKESSQSNYTIDTLDYRFRFGVPVAFGDRLRVFASQGIRFDRVLDGVVPGLPSTGQLFPGLESQPPRQTTYFGAGAQYDTRDNGPATTRGFLAQTWAQFYPKDAGNEGNFQFVGLDLREFVHPYPWFIVALQAHAEQHFGYGIPFYDQSQLGGKDSLRGYGDGRFEDRGAAYANLETRFLAEKFIVRNAPVEFWVDPFLGSGTVFHDLSGMTGNPYHDVVGVAFRFIARPQVVGSVDLGYGGEGVAVFTDIGYSF
jgi:outer membrane protein assembly factor BamA